LDMSQRSILSYYFWRNEGLFKITTSIRRNKKYG
jgi:hypothetical protein